MIVINTKNYKLGKELEDLIKKIEIYYPKSIVAVPATEIKEVVKNTNLKVYSQHVDFQEQGRGTGLVMPESISGAGCEGSLLNHSEHKIKFAEIKKTLKRCNEVGLKIIVCVSNLKEAEQIKKLNPYAIAFEDKDLISTGKSITEHNSEAIKKFVKLLKDTEIIPLCGAGISKGEDVAAALVLGCKGVLVASAIANSSEPEKLLKEIAQLL